MPFIGKYDGGSWSVASKIGVSDYGAVYKIAKKVSGSKRYAALKVIPVPQSRLDLRQLKVECPNRQSLKSRIAGMSKEVEKEVKLVQAFSATNIASFDDVRVIVSRGGESSFVLARMELLESLELVFRSGKLTEDGCVRMGISACRALEALAKKKAVHGNVKPSNILQSWNGIWKLSDIGLARKMDELMSKLPRKETCAYMAPEAFRGLECGASVDTYSLGLVMHWLLNNGRMPFVPARSKKVRPSEYEDAFSKRMRGEPLPPPAEADPELAKIILKACSYAIGNRHESATELRSDLESFASLKRGRPATAADKPNPAPLRDIRKLGPLMSLALWKPKKWQE
jgi:serine/threonine protein kinase